jgi:hypothetical protein
MGPLGFVLILAVLASFVTAFAVAGVATARRKEREALYRSEERKKAIEHGSVAQLQELIREDERVAQRRAREGTKFVGLILTAIGVVIPVGVAMQGEIVGAVFSSMTLMVGIAVLVYVYVLAPKPDGEGR